MKGAITPSRLGAYALALGAAQRWDGGHTAVTVIFGADAADTDFGAATDPRTDGPFGAASPCTSPFSSTLTLRLHRDHPGIGAGQSKDSGGSDGGGGDGWFMEVNVPLSLPGGLGSLLRAPQPTLAARVGISGRRRDRRGDDWAPPSVPGPLLHLSLATVMMLAPQFLDVCGGQGDATPGWSAEACAGDLLSQLEAAAAEACAPLQSAAKVLAESHDGAGRGSLVGEAPPWLGKLEKVAGDDIDTAPSLATNEWSEWSEWGEWNEWAAVEAELVGLSRVVASAALAATEPDDFTAIGGDSTWR